MTLGSCLICGVEHEEYIKDDILLCYMGKASSLIFDGLLKASILRQTPSPICSNCGKEFKSFLKYYGPLIAAQFLVHIAEKGTRSIRVKEGLLKAKLTGKKLGRPSKITRSDLEKIALLKRKGMSHKKIALETGFTKSYIGKVVRAIQKPDFFTIPEPIITETLDRNLPHVPLSQERQFV